MPELHKGKYLYSFTEETTQVSGTLRVTAAINPFEDKRKIACLVATRAEGTEQENIYAFLREGPEDFATPEHAARERGNADFLFQKLKGAGILFSDPFGNLGLGTYLAAQRATPVYNNSAFVLTLLASETPEGKIAGLFEKLAAHDAIGEIDTAQLMQEIMVAGLSKAAPDKQKLIEFDRRLQSMQRII